MAWEHCFPWWHSGMRYSLEHLTLGGEARWWMASQKLLSGHFLGVYGFWGKSDVQLGNWGCYQADGFWSTGLSYGYAFPVSSHLNLELSASVGYARIPYQHYIPSGNIPQGPSNCILAFPLWEMPPKPFPEHRRMSRTIK